MNGSSGAAPAGGAGEAVTNAKQVLNGSGPAAAAAAPAAASSSAVASGTEISPASAPALAPASSGGSENAASGAAGGGSRSRSPRPSPRPKKRQRPSLTTAATSVHTTVKNSDDEDDAAEAGQDESTAAKDAFYLRHQNKALASELRSYKRQIDLLAAERDNRRDRCDEAREGVDKLAEIWAEVEGCVKTALVGLELVRFSLLASTFAHDFFNFIRRGDKSSLGPIRKVPHQELLLPVNSI